MACGGHSCCRLQGENRMRALYSHETGAPESTQRGFSKMKKLVGPCLGHEDAHVHAGCGIT